MRGRVLVLNAGSSTLKASVLDDGSEGAAAAATVAMHGIDGVAPAVHEALETVARGGVGLASVDAVGHRVVHGGPAFTRTTLIDDGVVQRIRDLSWLAPLHNPIAAEVITAARAILPDVPHAAAFDSAFHSTLPEEAFVYAVPHEWYSEWGYRRYGFHGLSVAWSAERAAALVGRTDLGIVVAHLGAGCSVTAVLHGRSLGTSMGMTPMEGLVMGTRAGSVDPGILIAAQRDHGLDPRALEDALERHSGLLALSGRTAEMRDLLAVAPEDARAALAIAVFERSAAAGIAAAATALPRLDAIVFTGGIGEHAASVRAGIAGRLASIGVPPPPDAAAGTQGAGRDDAAVAHPGGAGRDDAVAEEGDRVLAAGPPAVLVVAAREDLVIAREVRTLVA